MIVRQFSYQLSSNMMNNYQENPDKPLRRRFQRERCGRSACFSRPQTGHRHRCPLQMYFKIRKEVENSQNYGILWPRISESSASCTRGFIPQWKLTEGTALFSNTEILVLSAIAAAEKLISIKILNFSPLPLCLRSEKLVHVQDYILPQKQGFFYPFFGFQVHH